MAARRGSFEYQTAVPRQSGLGFISIVFAVVAAVGGLILLYGAQDNYLRLAGAVVCAFLAWILAKMGKRRRIPVLKNEEAFPELLGE